MNENDRIPVEELNEHPFIAEQLMDVEMNKLDIEGFNRSVAATSRRFSCYSANNSMVMNNSTMTDRFNDSQIKATEVVLTTKASDQVHILLSQLVNATNFTSANFDMSMSGYFNKHYDASMQKPYIIGDNRISAADLASSLQESMNENHFDENIE